jgi:hypothetical protein
MGGREVPAHSQREGSDTMLPQAPRNRMQYSKQASNFASISALMHKTQMASVKAVLESGKDNPYEQYKVRHCCMLSGVLQDR